MVKNEGYTWFFYEGPNGVLGWIADEFVDKFSLDDRTFLQYGSPMLRIEGM